MDAEAFPPEGKSFADADAFPPEDEAFENPEAYSPEDEAYPYGEAELMRGAPRHFIHASDEWYILAGRELPPEESYDGYIQFENGVGMLRLLISETEKALAHYRREAAAGGDRYLRASRGAVHRAAFPQDNGSLSRNRNPRISDTE